MLNQALITYIYIYIYIYIYMYIRVCVCVCVYASPKAVRQSIAENSTVSMHVLPRSTIQLLFLLHTTNQASTPV